MALMYPDEMFTLIIPVYNEETRLVEECLMSVMTQQYFNFNLLDTIIVVDGSKEKYDELKSLKLEDRYSKLSLQIILNETNGGAGVARNVGIDNAKGMYVIFADCDDVYNNNLVFASIFKAVTDNWEFPDYLWMRFFEEAPQYDENHNQIGTTLVLHTDPLVWSFAKVMKREVLNKYNIRYASNIRIYEDTHFCAMAYALSNTCKFIDDISYFWRWRSDSTIRYKSEIKRFLRLSNILITNLYVIHFLEDILNTKLDDLSKEQIQHINEVMNIKSKLITDTYQIEQEVKVEQPNLLDRVKSITEEFRDDIIKYSEGQEESIEARLQTLPRYRESFYTWAERRGFIDNLGNNQGGY